MQIELILSKRASLCLQHPVLQPMTDSPGHFLAQWRVETAEDDDAGEWYMVTNCATLFTLLLPRGPTMRWPDVVALFRTRLRFALLAASPPAEITISGIVAVKGNPSQVVGSMNDMRHLLASGCRTPDCDDRETSLNRVPFSSIGTRAHLAFPEDVWQARLKELH